MDNLNLLDSNDTNIINSSDTNATIDHVAHVIGWVSFSIGLPAICLAIYVLCRKLVKEGKAPPVYVISLLISDIFNVFGRHDFTKRENNTLATDIASLIFYFGIVTNIVFMVCIAQERHVLVACPRCHAGCHRVKQSALISLAAWAAPFAILLLAYFGYVLLFSIALLLPFPFLVFFFVDSWRALACSAAAVPAAERRMILGMLAAILTNYSVLFLPFVLTTLLDSLPLHTETYRSGLAANLLLHLSPLVDPFLSIFLTKGARDVLEAFPCCRRKARQQEETHTVPTVSENVTQL